MFWYNKKGINFRIAQGTSTGYGSMCSAPLDEEILIFMRILVLILVIITILCGCNKTTIDSDINTSRPTEAIEFKIKENLVDNAYDEIISFYESILLNRLNSV